MAGTPFVGREPELASLKELRLRATRERCPAAVVVFGDPGSGKSRLLEEAAREAGQRLAMVGFEPERRIPLAAARPALRLLARVPEHGLGDRRERAEVSHEAAARLYDSVTRRSTAPSNEEPRPTE